MPEQFFGKKIEVIMVELNDSLKHTDSNLPVGKKISPNELFQDFGASPDFPSIEKIREKAWPSQW